MKNFKAMTPETRQAFWQQECKLFSKSGKNIREFVKDRGYSYSAFLRWHRLLVPPSGSSTTNDAWIPAKTISSEQNISASTSIRLSKNDVAIELPLSVPATWVAQLVSSFKDA